MVESKTNYYQNPIFEDINGIKYAINPFAGLESQNTEEAQEIIVSDQYNLFCSQCKLPFLNTAEYEHHNVELHGSKRLHLCNFCNATFRRLDHLKRHVSSIHSNQRYYLCPVCQKDCKRHDILLKHVKRKHSSESEVFTCRDCNFQCSNLQDLEKHEVSHLMTDRHMCPHCSTTFKRKDHMLRHVKSQHLNQCVICPVCGQKYKRKDHVVRHVREKHKMGMLNGKLVTSSDVL